MPFAELLDKEKQLFRHHRMEASLEIPIAGFWRTSPACYSVLEAKLSDSKLSLSPPLTALHNFIRIHEVIDPYEQEERAMVQAQPPDSGVQSDVVNEVTPQMETLRDRIAEQMWTDYQQILAQRRAR